MKNTTCTRILWVLFAAALLSLAACGSDSPPDSQRLAALEAEVQALKLESRARDTAFKEELAQIRDNLDGIRALIQVDKGRAEALKKPKTQGDKLDEEIDTKAKSFVSENLDRLLDITKKLLDKMEQELDEQMQKTAPKPKGDEI